MLILAVQILVLLIECAFLYSLLLSSIIRKTGTILLLKYKLKKKHVKFDQNKMHGENERNGNSCSNYFIYLFISLFHFRKEK